MAQPIASCDNLPAGTLSVEQAQTAILEALSPVQTCERLAIRDVAGRVLAQTITARFDVPPHRNSAMDGYAFRHDDLPHHDSLTIIGKSFAGRPFAGTVNAGECVRIMTGAVVPDGADTVVMQENTQNDTGSREDAAQLTILSAPTQGANIRHPGEDLQAGDTILTAGRKLNAADIGLLASLGMSEVNVLRRPRVAFFSTGDELKAIGEPLGVGDIYDSNRYTLHAMLQTLDVDIRDMGVIPDQPEAVEQAFLEARQLADVLITSGGVSVGDADHIQATLAKLGNVNFWKMAMKPGKPLAFGQLGSAERPCHFFGLPGNPVSVMATFLLFARPAILKLRGEQVTLPPEHAAICDNDLRKAPGRKDYQRGICHYDPTDGQWHVSSTGIQGSHMLRSMSQANCFIVLPQASGDVAAGSTVTILPFTGLL